MTTSLIPSPTKALTKPASAADFINLFAAALDLRVRSAEIAATTATNYVSGAKKFIEWSTVNRKGAGQPDTIREWKADLLQAGYKPGAVNAWMAGVRALFRWAYENKMITHNPTENIKGARRTGSKDHHARESLTDNEVRRLLAIPDTSTIGGKRDVAILSMMLYTAARGVEIHRANIADLKTRGGRLVLFIQGKGHDEKDDFLIISHAEDALRDWLGVRDPKATALFHSLSNRSQADRLSLPAYRHLVKHYMRLAGVQGNKTTHSLRHTAITKAVSEGIPLHKVSKGLARHKDPKTTMIYYHELDRISDPVEDHIHY